MSNQTPNDLLLNIFKNKNYKPHVDGNMFLLVDYESDKFNYYATHTQIINSLIQLLDFDDYDLRIYQHQTKHEFDTYHKILKLVNIAATDKHKTLILPIYCYGETGLTLDHKLTNHKNTIIGYISLSHESLSNYVFTKNNDYVHSGVKYIIEKQMKNFSEWIRLNMNSYDIQLVDTETNTVLYYGKNETELTVDNIFEKFNKEINLHNYESDLQKIKNLIQQELDRL